MEDEVFEIESEVRDLRHVAAPTQSPGSTGKTVGEVADGTSHPACGRVADGSKPGNVGQDVPTLDQVWCEHNRNIAGVYHRCLICNPIKEKEKMSEGVQFAPDMDWLVSLMCDKWLIKLRDVIEYRIKGEEYFRNPECRISCGCMRYIIVCIDGELKWRREKGMKVEY